MHATTESPTIRVNNLFKDNSHNVNQITAWVSKMPKGANLHLHMLGALYPKVLIKMACENNLFFNPQNFKFSKVEFDSYLPAEDLNNPPYYTNFCNAITLRSNGACGRTPHDHFMYDCFTPIFDLIDFLNIDEVVEKVREQEKLAGVQYLEMYIPYTLFLKIDFKSHNFETTPKTRFIFEVSRTQSNDQFDEEVEECANICSTHPLAKAITIVGAEDDPRALASFDHQLETLKRLWGKFKIPYCIHAGELTGEWVAPEDLSDHVFKVLQLPGVRRIGHAFDIVNEKKLDEIVKTFKAKDIAVEHCPISNRKIWQLPTDKLILGFLIKNGIPAVVGSDDPAVLAYEGITQDFVDIVCKQEVPYVHVKMLILNSITYSLLSDPEIEQELALLTDKFSEFEKSLLNPALID